VRSMPTEQEAIANLTEGEDRWLQLWSFHLNTFGSEGQYHRHVGRDSAGIDSLVLGHCLVSPVSTDRQHTFGSSTVLVLFSAGAWTRVAWVPFFSSRMIAEAGNIGGGYTHIIKSRLVKLARCPGSPRAERKVLEDPECSVNLLLNVLVVC